jgi:NAD(P)-dependent dehydrogenase (short-subunit alcohol dehydrogenase family)
MSNLSGKVAFIANASSLVGQACASKLAAAGARICGSCTDRYPLDSADLSIEITANEAESWDSAFKTCIAELGSLDVLVIPTQGKSSSSIELLEYDVFVESHRAMAVPAFLAQNQGILAMRSLGRGGAVIHVLPAAARAGLDGAVAACTASAGILFSSKSAALECAKEKDGIVVNAVLAGPVEGEPELSYPPGTPVVPPDAVADAVLFYAAEGAVYMSGMDLPVDDGFLAQ